MNQTKKIDPILQDAATAVRKMLMLRGFFVRDIFSVDKDIVDIVAIKESLVDSERWRIRLIIPPHFGGLGTIPINEFFREQAKVHDLKGMIISLGSISLPASKLILKRNLNVFGLDWLKANTDFDIMKISEKKL